MKKALTGPDIGQLVKGWQTLLGSRVDQFGRPDLNKVVLKLRSRERYSTFIDRFIRLGISY